MTCQHCGGNAHNAYLCGHCTTELRTMLLDLVIGPENHGHPGHGLLEDLRDAATDQTRFTDPAPAVTAGAPDSRTPRLNPAASKLLADIHTQMCRIAACLPVSDPICGRATSSTPSTEKVAIWLAGHAKTIANHIAAEQTYCQLHATTARILRTIDRPPPTRYAGPCDCGTRLHAPLDAREAACPNCGIIHDIDARQRELLADLVNAGKAFTRDEFPVALSMLGVPYSARSFRRHRATGELPIAGYTDTGQPLYRPADLPKISQSRSAVC